MDETVIQAMAKWPNVPAVYGWLALDRRGTWLIKGEAISNPLIVEFIGRNYGRDDRGRWFFQNGPQRVFVRLDYTPYVYRITASRGKAAPALITTHTAMAVRTVNRAHLDEQGNVLLCTEAGIGVVDDRDLEALTSLLTDSHGLALPDDQLESAIEALRAGQAPCVRLTFRHTTIDVTPVQSREIPDRYGFVPSPAEH